MLSKSRKSSKVVNTGKTDHHRSASDDCSNEPGGLRHFTAGNIDAVLKSAEILSRGVRVLTFNVYGAASMTIDDGLSGTRALMDCRAVPEWIELQTELIKLNVGRAAIRTLLLSVMTIQVTEEALFPLIRRANAGHGLTAKTMGV